MLKNILQVVPQISEFFTTYAFPLVHKKSLCLTNTVPSMVKTDKSPMRSNISTSNIWAPNLQTFNPNSLILLRELVVDTELYIMTNKKPQENPCHKLIVLFWKFWMYIIKNIIWTIREGIRKLC